MAENFPNLVKYITKGSRSLVNSKPDKLKKIHVKTQHNQTSEN